MSYDDTFWIVIWSIVSTAITVIIVSILVECHMTHAEAFKNGYEKTSITGLSGSHWVKIK